MSLMQTKMNITPPFCYKLTFFIACIHCFRMPFNQNKNLLGRNYPSGKRSYWSYLRIRWNDAP